MVDVIPGATYYDSVMDSVVTCESIAPREGEVDVVNLSYEDTDGVVEVPFHLLLESETFEVEELPY